MLTGRVDLPAKLAFVADPWKALNRPAVHANTGIVFTELGPWSRVARDELRRGHVPLWNRTAASGAPLLANQQTAMFHPFTLLGLFLSLGKAFTLTASLRLFTLLFFTFVLFQRWGVSEAASLFGAVAYSFCAFHIVWLLFPLGLSSMMLPLILAGADLAARESTIRAHAFLTIALSCSVLGGHPESAAFTWIVGAAYAGYLTRSALPAMLRCASAFLAATALTAFVWYPTIEVLEITGRYQVARMEPASHGLSRQWFWTLINPNILGTPQRDDFTPPKIDRGVVLSDYGEVASGYAGLATLALALASLRIVRRKPKGFLVALAALSFCTFAEVPVWRDIVHHIPLIGIALNQRLRLFWAFGVVALATLALDEEPRARIRSTAPAIVLMIALLLALWHTMTSSVIVPIGSAVVIGIALWRAPRHAAVAAALVTFCELGFLTWNYNPPAPAEEVYPQTEAIRRLQQVPQPSRMVAWGWSFIPDTPGAYGLEDVKTTDPIHSAHYARLFRGYLRAEGYDSIINDLSYPFFDYLNIRSIYAPPGTELSDPDLDCVYRGADGVIYANRNALPRYFAVPHFRVEPSFDVAVALMKQIRDFREEAIVDRIPDAFRAELAQGLAANANVSIETYEGQRTVLHVSSRGSTLLVSSDVNWPGWRAYVNGRRSPTVMVNGAFLGCFVPSGVSRVELVYRPDGYVRGLRIAAAGLLALLLAYAFSKIRSQRLAIGR